MWTRVFGTAKMLLVDVVHKPEPTPRTEAAVYAEQVWRQVPVAVERWAAPSLTCADCAFFDADRHWCRARDFMTQPTLPSCEFFDGRPAQGA